MSSQRRAEGIESDNEACVAAAATSSMSLTALPQPPPSLAIPELSSHCPHESLHGFAVLFLLPSLLWYPPSLAAYSSLESGALVTVPGTWPAASSAGAKQRQGDGVEGEARSDLQALLSTTLGSDFPEAPLPTNIWACHGETKTYKPQ